MWTISLYNGTWYERHDEEISQLVLDAVLPVVHWFLIC